MAKNKYYAIRKGFKCNVIVESWEECQKLINGYSGAEYKGYAREEDARGYLVGEVNKNAEKPPTAQIKVHCEAKCEYNSNDICTSKRIKIDKYGQCKNF